MSVLSPYWDVLLLAATGLLAGFLESRRGRGRVLAGGVLLALALAGLRIAVLNAGGYSGLPRSFSIVSLALVLLAVALVLAGLRTPAAVEPTPLMPPLPPAGWAVLSWVHVAAVVTALVAPSLDLFFGSVLLAALAGWFAPGRGWFRPVPLLATAVLLAGWYFIARVAGPDTAGLVALRDAPFSAAFELAAAAALLGLAWVLLGLVPFHLMRRGSLTPILGGVLLVRLAAPVLPGGLAHWQPVAYPVVVLSILVAVWQRDRGLAALTLAVAGLLAGEPGAGWAGLALIGVALALEAEARFRRRGGMRPGGAPAPRALLSAVGGLTLVPVLAGGLAAETVYTAAIALLAAVAFARDGAR